MAMKGLKITWNMYLPPKLMAEAAAVLDKASS